MKIERGGEETERDIERGRGKETVKRRLLVF